MSEQQDPRRIEALRRAYELFLRYGFKKTSMDDIARAVGLSRQGLYLWFPSKKQLFMEMADQLEMELRQGIEGAINGDGPLEARLVEAFDHLHGQHMEYGLTPRAVDELMEAARQWVGDRVPAMDAWFKDLLRSVLPTDAKGSAQERAEILLAVSYGSKYRLKSKAEYHRRMATAIRLVLE